MWGPAISSLWILTYEGGFDGDSGFCIYQWHPECREKLFCMDWCSPGGSRLMSTEFVRFKTIFQIIVTMAPSVIKTKYILFQINRFIYNVENHGVIWNTSILLCLLWNTHRATVRCHCDIYIDLVSFEARVQVVHQGLLGHRLQAAQVVHAELAVAGGRSTGPTRTSRFWNRKCISDLFQMQNMCHFISDAKVWKVWIFGRPWGRREWWRQLELGSHFLKLNLQGTMVFTCQHQFLLCLIFHCFIFPLARA